MVRHEVRHGWYHHPENPMSPWHNWIAQPPPKGQVAGSTPAGDTTNVGVLRKRLKNSSKMEEFFLRYYTEYGKD